MATETVNPANGEPIRTYDEMSSQIIAKGEAIAAGELEAGTCVINTAVFTDPRLPCGGNKASGFGRELSLEGIRELTNVKTVHVR